MKKYQKLVVDYAEEIDEIKELKAAMRALANEANQYVGLNSDKIDDLQAAYSNLHKEYADATMSLRHEIEVEYHASINREAAQKGMDKFWELAFG